MTHDWISVTEKVPEYYERVLVAVNSYDDPAIGKYCVEEHDEGNFEYWTVEYDLVERTLWALSMGKPEWYHEYVTHWMPMPKMPWEEE